MTDQKRNTIIAAHESSVEREVLNADSPVLIDLSATGCGPCRRLHPIIASLAQVHAEQLKVVESDAGGCPELTSRAVCVASRLCRSQPEQGSGAAPLRWGQSPARGVVARVARKKHSAPLRARKISQGAIPLLVPLRLLRKFLARVAERCCCLGVTPPCRSVSRAMLPLLLAQLFLVSVLSGAAHAGDAGEDPAADIVLTNGVTYRARLRLNFFQCLASEDRIARKFGDGGFVGVHVFMSARDLPADWPEQFRSKAGSCERYAEGVWARPTMPRRRPSSIDAWWVAAAGVPDEPVASLERLAPLSSRRPSARALSPCGAARPSRRWSASVAHAVDVELARSLA
jgi:thiol-disulfide isomerase/thioredoxin